MLQRCQNEKCGRFFEARLDAYTCSTRCRVALHRARRAEADLPTSTGERPSLSPGEVFTTGYTADAAMGTYHTTWCGALESAWLDGRPVIAFEPKHYDDLHPCGLCERDEPDFDF